MKNFPNDLLLQEVLTELLHGVRTFPLNKFYLLDEFLRRGVIVVQWSPSAWVVKHFDKQASFDWIGHYRCLRPSFFDTSDDYRSQAPRLLKSVRRRSTNQRGTTG